MRDDEEKRRREKEEETCEKVSQVEALIQRTVAIERKVQIMPPEVIASLPEKHNLFMVLTNYTHTFQYILNSKLSIIFWSNKVLMTFFGVKYQFKQINFDIHIYLCKGYLVINSMVINF